MQLIIDSNSFLVFDLDDTLFQELDYLKSGYAHIASELGGDRHASVYEAMLDKYQNRENVFEWLVTEFRPSVPNLDIQLLLKLYREHLPNITLSESTLAFIDKLKKKRVPAGLITDGRSLTQRNKLKSLGIADFFQDVIISEEFGSEKPDERNFLYFEKKYPGRTFCFFGDNTSKDFIVPAKLGWKTVCLKSSGSHIHQQTFDKHPVPDFVITGFHEIELI